MYVLYALSLDGFGIKLTEIGQSDPWSYLAAAAKKSFVLWGGCRSQILVIFLSVFFEKLK